MAGEDENEGLGIALAAAANATGVPTTIKGKVQRAILRLIVGSINPDHIEKMRANVSTVEGRSRIDAMVAEEIGRQAISDPVFMERAKARFLGELAQKQENVEAVATKAQQKINAAPDADASPSEPDVEPSQDWMNTFTRAAEDASSEDLRERLAAVLAGEARKPGTYSRSTVRLIAELERDVLLAFQLVLANRVGDGIVRETSWTQGEGFVRGIILEDAGLISGTHGFTHRTMPFDANAKAFLVGDSYGLIAEAHAGTPEKQAGLWMLTRAGQEVASLLPPTNERLALKRFSEILDKTGLKRIIVGPILSRRGNDFQILNEEIVWQAGTVTTSLV
jgi:hypothetical protein